MGENNNNDLYEITVDGKTATLSKPNRATLKIVLSKISGGNPNYIEAGEILLKTCWVDGDPALKDFASDENAELNLSACLAAVGLVQLKNSDLKKL